MGQSNASLILVNSSAELPAAVDGHVGFGSNETRHYGRVGAAWIPFGYSSEIVTGPFLSAGISTHGNTGGTTGLVSNRLLLVGSNNITLSQSVNGGSATLSIIGGAGGAGDGYNILAAGTQTANTTGTVLFQNSNGITFGMSNSSVITAQHNALTSQSNQALSGSNGSFTFQTATFGALNGLTFYTSNGSMVGSYTQLAQAASANNGSYTVETLKFRDVPGLSFSSTEVLGNSFIQATHNGITSQSNQQMTLFATSNTTQSSSGTSNASSLIFNGAGIASIGITNGSVVVSATQSNQALSGSNGSFTFQTATFGALNGLSFYTSNGSLVGSHNALTSQSNQALSGSNGSFAFQTATFGNLNGASFYTSNGSMVLSYTVPAGGAFSAGISTQGNTAGTTGFAASQLLLVGSNNITLSQSVNLGSATLSIIGGAGGGGFSAGVSTGGNTAGTTGTVGSQIVLVGTSNVTLSQSINGNSATISFIAPAPGGGAGATVSAYPMMPYGMATSSNYTGVSGNTGASTQITGSFHVAPMPLPAALSFGRVNIIKSYGTIAGTGSQSINEHVGVYTLNGGSALSLVSSFMMRHEISQNSVTARTHRFYWGTDSTSNSTQSNGNISASYTGLRNIILYRGTGSFSAGMYWIVYNQWNRSSNAAVMPAATMQYISESQTTQGPLLGSTNLTCPYPYIGLVSSTTNTNVLTAPFMPISIHTSAITNSGGTSQWKWPYVHFCM